MRRATLKVFSLGLLSAFLLLQNCGLWAGQKSSQLFAAFLQPQKSISSDESLLSEYRLERAAIQRNLNKNKSSAILKQKLKILDNKIAYLENQLKRSRPAGKPSSNNPTSRTLTHKFSDIMFPSAKPLFSRPSGQKPVLEQKPKPITYKEQQTIVQAPVPMTLSEEQVKISSVFETKPALVPIVPPQPPRLESAQSQTSLSRPFELQPAPDIHRANPVSSATVAPVSVNFKQPEQQISMNSGTVSPKQTEAVSPQENISQTMIGGENESVPIGSRLGSDWLKMTRDDKELYIFSAMGALVKHDIVSMKPSYFYIQSLDEKVKNDHEALSQDLDSLFIANVYENEPDTRGAIDKIGQNPNEF